MKKKSGKKAATSFKQEVKAIESFLVAVGEAALSDAHVTWTHEYAIIRLYRALEDLILNSLIAAINNDTGQLSMKTGVAFPKHLTDGVCAYLIEGDGYFDFRGRDGLIRTLKKFLPDTHYLLGVVKDSKYKDALDRLVALRNLAAHDSRVAKSRALVVLKTRRISSSGAWIKKQNRFHELSKVLVGLSDEIHSRAPY